MLGLILEKKIHLVIELHKVTSLKPPLPSPLHTHSTTLCSPLVGQRVRSLKNTLRVTGSLKRMFHISFTHPCLVYLSGKVHVLHFTWDSCEKKISEVSYKIHFFSPFDPTTRSCNNTSIDAKSHSLKPSNKAYFFCKWNYLHLYSIIHNYQFYSDKKILFV